MKKKDKAADQLLPLNIQMYLLGVMVWFVLPLLFYVPLAISVLFVVLCFARLVLLMLGIQSLSRWILVVLILVVTALVYRNLGTILGREGGVSLLILLMVLKSFESKTRRDWHLLLQIQLLAMGVVLLFNQHFWVVLWVLFDLWLFLSVLALTCGVRSYRVLWQSAKMILISLPCAIAVFMVLPKADITRSSEAMFDQYTRESSERQIGRTGNASNTLEAGKVGQLIQTNNLVFNAEFDQPAQIQPKDLYWRETVMGLNRRGVWYAIEKTSFEPESEEYPVQRHTPIGYQLFLKDNKDRIPALDYPLAVGADQERWQWKAGYVLRLNEPADGWQQIHLQSALSDRVGQNLTVSERQYYTQLPKGMNLQTRRLAQELAARSHSDEDFVQHVLAFFHQGGFVYTLSPRRSDHWKNRTDFFLLDGREGFCEDYADAMVWLARSVGIPARIVTGYLGAEPHSNGKFWQVRGKNAHAWTEIWLQDKKIWWRVDPTGAVSSERIEAGITEALPKEETASLQSSAPWLDKYVQSGQFYWQRWVIDYDHKHSKTVRTWFKTHWIAIGVFLLLLGVAGWWYRRWRADSVLPLNQGWRLLAVVLEMEEEDWAVMGPEEVKAVLIQVNMMTPQLMVLLDQYIAWVYAATQLPPLRQQRHWLRQLRREVARIQKASG
ncbi:DUF3488 and transglutaminase-like domain-containing protein [Neisseriaceae bacterium ESL0693]|nr:DUF3488 and transglutaminase-like domain-containing protein [Neisseriaceae bacterium ESL0693]